MKKTNKNKNLKNKIKILFVAILMLASVFLISAGDIIFKAGNLDVSNNLAVNTDALYVDSANKKVGIGTTSPDTKLEVAGTVLFSDGTNDWLKFYQNELWLTGRNQNEQISINYKGYQDGSTQFRDVVIYDGKNNAIFTVDGSAGKVGIGTTSPRTKLEVAGIAGVGSDDGVYIQENGAIGEIVGVDPGVNAFNDIGIRATSGTQLYLKTDGKIGIGTTSPTEMLTLGTGGNIKLQDGNAVVWGTGSGGTEFQTGNGVAHTLSWYTNSLVRILINSQGNVGIGTTSPAKKLHVVSGVDNDASAIFDGISSRLNLYSYPGYNEILSSTTANNAQDLSIRTSGAATSQVYIKTSGNVGIGTTNPTEKLQVAGAIKAKAFKTGDIFFNKDDKPVWRMFEDENGLYVESLTTGKNYRVVLEEIK